MSTFTPTHDFTISKQALKQIKVINQVDLKFILCLVPSETSGSTLVVVDQHAADERVQLEKWWIDFFGNEHLGNTQFTEKKPQDRIEVVDLLSPLSVVLTRREITLLQRFNPIFEQWGIKISRSESASNEKSGYFSSQNRALETEDGHVLVTTLPRLIADRLMDTRLLTDLIHQHLGYLESNPTPSIKRTRANCPRVIHEILNSKACRGAIMFGDSLSLTQCQELIHQLGQCVFPFQCAHGRPSIVPLIDVGKNSNCQEKCHKTFP